MKATLYADGASFGNPGDSGVGIVIKTAGKTHERSEYIGTATNNVAEYTALVRGLEEAGKLGVTELEINLDSELLVKQIRGEYRVKNKNLKPLFVKAMALLGSLVSYSITHVPRKENKHADRLAKTGAEKHKKKQAADARKGSAGSGSSSIKGGAGKDEVPSPKGQTRLPF
jgi:ribonuclease HI